MEGCEEITIVRGCAAYTKFMKNGECVAKRKLYKAGTIYSEFWSDCNDDYHREDDKPAVLYHSNGCIFETKFYIHGKKSRDDDRPAVIKMGSRYEKQSWYRYGARWRGNDKPSKIVQDGQEVTYMWLRNKVYFRKNGKPAKEVRRHDVIVSQSWMYGKVQHRNDGPAVICKKRDQMVYRYFKFGIECSPKAIERMRIPQDIRRAFRLLPLPVADAIIEQYWYDWQFVE